MTAVPAMVAPLGSQLTSRELCWRAIRAHERLYRLLGCDDPDLAANVTFMTGRIRLLRLAAAAPWVLSGAAVDALLGLIESAEGVRDPVVAERLFPGFAEEVCARLERRRGPRLERFSGPSRRAADRLWRRESEVAEHPARPADGGAVAIRG